ncbi:hypothetical protein LTR84_010287 [Exophiala bonariae]|uniref:Enoyl reductase (ER) domain-containing protein n=1 Tax=Exophiala bonariae TaxID=1690606 RepID=A0AAV9MX48_9EURO|nr:hypothetical protein LTR84_010287 [Exophiala bonariae]
MAHNLPRPVLPNVVPTSDAACTVTHVSLSNESSPKFTPGTRVSPIQDIASLTTDPPSQTRCWLAADTDGVLATHVVFPEHVLVKIPTHLSDAEASILPCAGVTAWTTLQGLKKGDVVLIQGTGGVSLVAVKFVVAMGGKVILSTASAEKARRVEKLFSGTEGSIIGSVNYASNLDWHEEVLNLTGGVGVDLVLENGGTSSLVKSFKCTKRGGIVSQVGYLGKQDPAELKEMLPLLIDRKILLRGINVGSRQDFEEMNQFIDQHGLHFVELIDRTFSFEDAERAIEYLGEVGPFGKIIIEVKKSESLT